MEVSNIKPHSAIHEDKIKSSKITFVKVYSRYLSFTTVTLQRQRTFIYLSTV